ncbi:protein SIEVE ELEMENT OCCLUSION B-like isoform X2 [Ipomoea triloba]|uniref:protein SIEVE ELEMENT OCCLUSION B-like isoform X2 n=1 Tax=Ipomoea triloba TaxID=35885 RepID=UPI00125E2B88|nr:protein SIEVE ELEMENT OCCLUSION B-like isoform X2 [Ipomoea triloba]
MDLDESIIVEHVIATHACSGGINFNSKFVLDYVEKALNNTDLGETQQDSLNTQLELIHEDFSYQIRQLSSEISFKSLNEIDDHRSTICLLEKLSAYTWEAKVVMMLAAFAGIYGNKLNILSQQSYRNRLAIFKQTLCPTPSYNNIEKLVNDDSIKLMLNLAKCVADLYQLSSSSPPQSLILANYWITRNVLHYAHQILSFEPKNEVTEESTLIDKTKSILSVCYQLLDDEAIFYGCKIIGHRISRFENRGLLLMITSSTNVSEIIFLANELRLNRYVRTIWIPIVDYPDMWSNENSDWNLKLFDCCYRADPLEKIAPQFIRFVLKTCFPAFQIGGDPIIISLDNRGRLVHFNAFHMMMTWGNNELDAPKVIGGANLSALLLQNMKQMILYAGANYVIDDIDNRINIFVNDFSRRIINWTDDINSEMNRSVRSYNYTSSKEKALWNAETWSVNLVAHPFPFSAIIREWSDKGECIFLYGGNNIKCVEEFAMKIKEISSKIQLEMKLAYVGKSMKVKSVVENISDYVHDTSNSRRFWLRLGSVLVSRINYLNEIGIDERGDNITTGLKKIASL